MRYVLIASLALAQTIPAQAQSNRPKFTRASAFALGIECEFRRIAKAAPSDGIFLKSLTGKLTLDRTSKNSASLGISSAVPFEVFELGPNVEFTNSNSQKVSVDFEFKFKADDPIPAECVGVKIPTYSLNGKLLGEAKLSTLPSFKSVYNPNSANARLPAKYNFGQEFGTAVTTGSSLTINLIVFKVKLGGEQRQVAATAKYEVTAEVDTARTLAALKKERSR